MLEYLRLLLFPAFVFVGWFASGRAGVLSDRLARMSSILLMSLLFFLGISGWLRPDGLAATAHRFSGYLFVISSWLFVPFVIGVVLRKNARISPLIAIGQVATLLILLGIVLLASSTGYLGPSYIEPTGNHLSDEETYNRYILLHFFILPGLTSMLLIVWFTLFRKLRGRREISAGLLDDRR